MRNLQRWSKPFILVSQMTQLTASTTDLTQQTLWDIPVSFKCQLHDTLGVSSDHFHISRHLLRNKNTVVQCLSSSGPCSMTCDLQRTLPAGPNTCSQSTPGCGCNNTKRSSRRSYGGADEGKTAWTQRKHPPSLCTHTQLQTTAQSCSQSSTQGDSQLWKRTERT